MDYLGDVQFLSQWWEQFLLYLNAQPAWRIYVFLFLGAFMENVFPPIPGDTLIVFGAYLAGMEIIEVLPAYLAMWVGSAVGCMLVYGVAYWKGRGFFLGLNSRLCSEENLARTERWFSRYGDRIVIFNRFLPTVRMFVGVVAGISRMHPLRMLLYVLFGTFLWNSLLVYFGLQVGQNWRVVMDVLHMYNRIIIGLMAVAGIGYWIWWRKKKRTPVAEDIEQEDRMDRRA